MGLRSNFQKKLPECLCDNNDPVSLEMSFSKNTEIINDKEVHSKTISDASLRSQGIID